MLRLATTTSTADSGLLDAILPEFEDEFDARVDVVALGTGQAIELGEAGDADVILVHARAREDAFVAEGHGTARYDVMYNDFIIVGPAADPAGIGGMATAAEALAAIAAAEATFASRGDDSGTHTKELSLWDRSGVTPPDGADWYKSLGQGMGETSSSSAAEAGAYTLTDRATFLAQQASLSGLVVLVGGASIAENQDTALLNPYGVIPVKPDKGGIDADLAQDFVDWITSLKTQEAIAAFGHDEFGQSLFYPDSEAWRTTDELPRRQGDRRAATTLMEVFLKGLADAFRLLWHLDPDVIETVGPHPQGDAGGAGDRPLAGSLLGRPSAWPDGCPGVLFVPVIYTGMALPPVVVGLFTYLLLSNQGPLGSLGWLFTPTGMVLAQIIIALPARRRADHDRGAERRPAIARPIALPRGHPTAGGADGPRRGPHRGHRRGGCRLRRASSRKWAGDAGRGQHRGRDQGAHHRHRPRDPEGQLRRGAGAGDHPPRPGLPHQLGLPPRSRSARGPMRPTPTS